MRRSFREEAPLGFSVCPLAAFEKSRHLARPSGRARDARERRSVAFERARRVSRQPTTFAFHPSRRPSSPSPQTLTTADLTLPLVCLHPWVLVAQKVAVGVYKGVTTSELDELAAETAASMTSSTRTTLRCAPAALFARDSTPRACLRPRHDSRFSRRAPVVFANNTLFKRLGPTRLTPPPRTTFAARRSHRRLQPPQEHQEVFLGDVRARTGVQVPFSGDASREYSNSMSKRERFKYSKPEGLAWD